MVREVLTISVGQAGIQLGSSVWEQYCAEHKVGKDGKWGLSGEKSLLTFFEETSAGQFVPRNVAVDLEPTTVDEVRNGAWNRIFHPEFLLNGKEDAANNFARGHYTTGKEIVDTVNDRIRKLVENSENPQGFLMNHSVGGGTGSGLGSLILERLAVDYRKKSKIGFELYPSPTISTAVVEPYNALLTTHWLLDHTEVSLLLDNEAIYKICQNNLAIKRPSYDNLNQLIAKVISSMTASLRFEGEMNVDMNEFQTNLVPFPRLHFMTTAISPVTSVGKKDHESMKVQEITDAVFQTKSMLVDLQDFDPVEDKYMAISLNYRGEVSSKDANSAVQWLKQNNKVTFVEWCPTGFKIGLNNQPPASVENEEMAEVTRSAVMIGNNVAVNRVFTDRITRKFDLMYSQRAFVHWFVGEGMEEGEFAEAREDLGFLEKDYLDVVTEQASDEAGDDEEF